MQTSSTPKGPFPWYVGRSNKDGRPRVMDATGKVICEMVNWDEKAAELIVERVNHG